MILNQENGGESDTEFLTSDGTQRWVAGLLFSISAGGVCAGVWLAYLNWPVLVRWLAFY